MTETVLTDSTSVVVPVWPYYSIDLDDGGEDTIFSLPESDIDWHDEDCIRINFSDHRIQIITRTDVWFKDDQLTYKNPEYVAPEQTEQELEEEDFYYLPVTVQGKDVTLPGNLLLAFDGLLTLTQPILVVGEMMDRWNGANIHLPRSGQWHLQIFIDRIVETMEVTIRICDPIGKTEVEYHDDYHLTYEVI